MLTSPLLISQYVLEFQAGNGIKARTVPGLLLQNRGLSWSIGGDGTFSEHTTLPNILKIYDVAGALHGYSVKTGPRADRSISHLNVGSQGSTASDLPGQADMLITRMKHESGVDFVKDWKVITIFIGSNDICGYCDDKDKYSVNQFEGHMKQTLDILQANIPRAFVNVVHVLNVVMVRHFNRNPSCSILHWFLCKCAAFPSSKKALEEEIKVTEGYRRVLEELVNSGRYDTNDDFTVVIQPFLSKAGIPNLPSGKTDYSYLAPDCFHLSEKGHAAFAEGLWNNMNEPVGSKSLKWEPDDPIVCPSPKFPYFYTNKNSNEATGQYQR
ncbi:hypothetical protein ScPMuIL_014807 [Solemya velum]